MKRPTMLMILDGFGRRNEKNGNAIWEAHTPNLDKIEAECPGGTLLAAGEAVGLPEGVMGNSEVGHLNLGAGRIVYQELSRINKEIREGGFAANPTLNAAMDRAKANGTAVHLMGLLSDGGVHSHIRHLFALIDMAAQKGLPALYVHAFLDGRDVPPRCAAAYIDTLEEKLKAAGFPPIATVSGRYYAMDRDQRWERLLPAYDALTKREGRQADTAASALSFAYENGEDDEFVIPTVVSPGPSAPQDRDARIKTGDSVIFFNFRPDRAREITRSLVDPDFTGFSTEAGPKDLYYVCMTQYDKSMPNVQVAYPPQSLKNTLGEYLSSLGLTQLHIAETEKYAHVTFFFNGGVEAPYEKEDRVLIPSPKVATYDLQPSMSAPEVTEAVLEKIESGLYDFIVLNFANCDMVGHTGCMAAAVKAVETVDACAGRVIEAVLAKGGQVLLTADHGNAESMVDEQGNKQTAHSLNPVPVYLIGRPDKTLKKEGVLADVSPTLLEMMDLPGPAEMTGESLLV